MEPQEIQDIVLKFPELKEHFKNANTTEKNKRFPHVDNAIRKLFTLEENEILTFYNFQKYVTRLFPKIKSDLITNDTETDMYNESFEHSNLTSSVTSVIAESSR